MYMQQIAAPLLFAFASVSLVLSSMQVLVSAPTTDLGLLSAYGTRLMDRGLWVFCISVWFLSGIVWILLFVGPFAVLVWRISWGFKTRGAHAIKPTMGA